MRRCLRGLGEMVGKRGVEMSRILSILFNTEMVRAILDGRKAETRRVIKPQPLFHSSNIIETYQYQPGDILYVRETWCRGSLDNQEEQYYYKADTNDFYCRWCPSIHMPRAAARIWLDVKDARIERLQDIDDDGVLAEGLQIGDPFDELWDSTIKKVERGEFGWDANPWVWVIKFERCGRAHGFLRG